MFSDKRLQGIRVNLRQRIETAGMRAGFSSQRKLAAACGVSQPWLAQVLAGDGKGHDLIQKIADLTAVSADWLRDGRPHDAPDWARDYADPDIEAFEQLRMHVLKKTEKSDQQAILPMHPSALYVSRWIAIGQGSGWSGDETSVWRGWCRHISQLEAKDIRQVAHVAEAARLPTAERDLAEANAYIAKHAVTIDRTKPVEPPKPRKQSRLMDKVEAGLEARDQVPVI